MIQVTRTIAGSLDAATLYRRCEAAPKHRELHHKVYTTGTNNQTRFGFKGSSRRKEEVETTAVGSRAHAGHIERMLNGPR